MNRLPDWKPRLRIYLDEVRDRPFEYGVWDCGMLTSGAIEAMTGENPLQALDPSYSSSQGVIKMMRKAGYEDHIAFVASFTTEIPPMYASFGDIAVLPGPDGPSFGIVIGSHIRVCDAEHNGVVELTEATKAFRV